MSEFTYKKTTEHRVTIDEWNGHNICIHIHGETGGVIRRVALCHEGDIPDDFDQVLKFHLTDLIQKHRPLAENETRDIYDNRTIYTMKIVSDKLVLNNRDSRLIEEYTEEELRYPLYDRRPERLAYFLKYRSPKKVTLTAKVSRLISDINGNNRAELEVVLLNDDAVELEKVVGHGSVLMTIRPKGEL